MLARSRTIPAVRQVLDAMRSVHGATAPELARATGFSRPSVDAALSRLEGEDMATRRGLAQSRGGRRATRFALIAESHLALGVAFHVPETTLVLVDLCGEVRWRGELALEKLERAAAIRHLREALSTGAEAAAGLRGRLGAVGLAMAGTISPDGEVSEELLRIPDWRNVRIIDEVGASTSAPIHVMRYLVAAGHAWAGQIQDDFDEGPALILQITGGVGVAVAGSRDNTWGGPNAGEFGQTVLRVGGEARSLEELLANSSFLARFRAEGGDPDIGAARAYGLAASGDRAARAAFDQTARYLAIALGNLAHLFDPSRIRVAGDIAHAGEALLSEVFDAARPAGRGRLAIDAAPVDHGLAAAGAAQEALERSLDRIFLGSSR